MIGYTCNVQGDQRGIAKDRGLHSYYAGGVTAIELKAVSKQAAAEYLASLGLTVLYIFE